MSNLFEPIPQLKLSDTFYTWWETTNAISAALNPLEIYDVSASYGITITRNSSGVATFSVDAGCGLRFDGNTLTLGINEANTGSVSNTDWFVFEKLNNSTNDLGTTDTTDCEWIRKVSATNMLPPTIAGSHTFSGSTITVDNNFIAGNSSSSMQLRSNSIRIGSPSGSKTSINSIGFFIDITGTDDDPNWIFRGDLSAWYTNQNIGISYDQAFVSDGPSGSTLAKFNFAPVENSQENTQINLLMGNRGADSIVTTDTDASISMTAKYSTNSLVFAHTSNDGSTRDLFSSQYNSNLDYSVFTVHDRMVITDVENSTPFISTKNGFAYQIPVTTTDGILNYNFTNRISTTTYTGAVGDVVRFDGTNYVPAQANTETNSKIVGIIESISGARAVIVLSGVFDRSGIVAGTTYYLDQQTAGAVTSTKPTSGLIKEVYVGLSTTSGMLFSSATSTGPTFSNVQITGDDLVTADVFGDTLTLTAGANITIERNTNNDILISAGTLAEAQYFSIIDPDGLTNIQASSASDTLRITGERGIFTYRNSSNELVIRGGRSFAVVQVLGQNTNELDYTVQAITGEDTLYLRSGVGINITSSTDNDILIEATGVSVPADESITNAKLADMQPFSIKAAQANGRPVDVFSDESYYVMDPLGYTVTPRNGAIAERYTSNSNPSVFYESLESISGDSVLGSAPHAEIAGYVFGRVTDSEGNVTGITVLGRHELRSILGASPDGFLEENSNLFNSWYLVDPSYNQIATQTANSKVGKLAFIEGNNISLSRIVIGSGPLTGTPAIKIDASGNLGFNRIINNRTGIDIMSGDTSGVIEITDYGAVSVTVDTNNGLTFDVKPESITNEMLANMPFNSIKASVYNTDEPNPIDLSVGTNTIVGRGSGNLKALSPSETRSVLGLTSSSYFKTLVTKNAVGTTIDTIESSTTEIISLKQGANILLTKTVDNDIVISSVGSSTGGINTVSFTDIVDGESYTPVSVLQFGRQPLNNPYGGGGTYYNIDYVPSFNQGTVACSFDLGLMPQYSIKVAGPTIINRNGAQGHLAANFVLQENHLLYRSSNALTSGTLSTIANNTGGIAHITNVSSDGISETAVPFGSKKLVIKAAEIVGNAISCSHTVDSTEIIFNLASTTTLENDSSPTLGANLNINKKLFFAPSSAASAASPNNRTVAEFVQTRTTSQDGVGGGTVQDSAYFKFDCGSGATGSNLAISAIRQAPPIGSQNTVRSIEINPLGTGSLILGSNRLSGSSNTPLVINSGRSSEPTLTVHSFNLIGNTNVISIGTIGTLTNPSTSDGKHLKFYSSRLSNGNAGTKDITFAYVNGVSNATLIGELITRGNTTDIGIFGSNTGNIILASGVTTVPNDGTIPTSGTGNIQFNSDILLNAKSIKASNDNITIDTGTNNNFTGALVLKSSNKSGYHRVKYGTRPQGLVFHIIDTLPTSNATEKANKYLLYLQNTSTPSVCGIVEFLVLANNDVFYLNKTSAILNGADLVDNAENLIQLRSATTNGASSPVNQNGELLPNPISTCATGEVDSNLHIILDPCLTGAYNYTLYKMSIQA